MLAVIFNFLGRQGTQCSVTKQLRKRFLYFLDFFIVLKIFLLSWVDEKED